MKLVSRDLWILMLVFVVGAVATYSLGLLSASPNDEPSSYSSGKHGLKALYISLDELGFRVGRHRGRIGELPPNVRVLIAAGEPRSPSEEELVELSRWIKKGNTFVATNSGELFGYVDEWFWEDLEHKTPKVPQRVGAVSGAYSRDVRYVHAYPSSFIGHDRSVIPIVKVGRGIVVAEKRVGKGRVILFTDPSMLANSGIRFRDNFILASNLVYENAGRHDRVLFLEWSRMPGAKEEEEGPLLGMAGRLAFAELLAVVLIVLLSSARRFGAVHPLKEREERRRGVEFVQAIAGLYRRAHAGEAALGAIYSEFRRELVTRIGVSPGASPSEAARSVLRSRSVDATRLAALLDKCERVSSGIEFDGREVVELVRAIEDFRRELGIARSTDN